MDNLLVILFRGQYAFDDRRHARCCVQAVRLIQTVQLVNCAYFFDLGASLAPINHIGYVASSAIVCRTNLLLDAGVATFIYDIREICRC